MTGPETPTGSGFSLSFPFPSFGSIDGISPVRMSSFKAIATPPVVHRANPFARSTTSEGGSEVSAIVPSASRVAGSNQRGGTGPSRASVAYLADCYDLKWIQSLAAGVSGTTRGQKGSGSGWISVLLFERIMSELEVQSFKHPNTRVHVEKELIDKWVLDSSLYANTANPSASELVSFVQKVENYWFEKRQIYPKIIRTGLVPELSRPPEEADGNSGESTDGVPLPFMRRGSAVEQWKFSGQSSSSGSTSATEAALEKRLNDTLTVMNQFLSAGLDAAKTQQMREELKHQHTEVTITQLALLRQAAKDRAGSGSDMAPSPDSIPLPSSRTYSAMVALADPTPVPKQ